MIKILPQTDNACGFWNAFFIAIIVRVKSDFTTFLKSPESPFMPEGISMLILLASESFIESIKSAAKGADHHENQYRKALPPKYPHLLYPPLCCLKPLNQK